MGGIIETFQVLHPAAQVALIIVGGWFVVTMVKVLFGE